MAELIIYICLAWGVPDVNLCTAWKTEDRVLVVGCTPTIGTPEKYEDDYLTITMFDMQSCPIKRNYL